MLLYAVISADVSLFLSLPCASAEAMAGVCPSVVPGMNEEFLLNQEALYSLWPKLRLTIQNTKKILSKEIFFIIFNLTSHNM